MAIHFISKAKSGLLALSLKRTLGVNPTVSRLHYKLMQAMRTRRRL